MRYWQTTAWALLMGVLLTPSLAAHGFEPVSFRSITRQFGVGWSDGYHARPCHCMHRSYYESVTNGGTPIGFTYAQPAFDVRNAGTTMFYPATDDRVFRHTGVGPQTPLSAHGSPSGIVSEGPSRIEDFGIEVPPLPSEPIRSRSSSRPTPSPWPPRDVQSPINSLWQ